MWSSGGQETRCMEEVYVKGTVTTLYLLHDTGKAGMAQSKGT